KRQKHSRRRRKEFQKAPSFSSSSSTPDIAIVGLAGRYPGARNMQEFWANLKGGKDCITPVPEERLALWQTPQKGEMWGGFLQDVDRFDPLFFHISPREAERMDPQERLFLECVYETLQDAGYTRQSLGAIQGQGMAGNVGVFVGVMYEEYQLYGAQEQLKGRPVAVNGNAASIANRVSYFCNFHGPSMAVDTMCSSSLTAIHLACQHLQRGSCEAAIAGGVNISIHPNKYVALNQGEFLSSKGRCESFGEGGDGYVPGEGVGAVLLKPLTQAVADGDHIYGVIKGTAINHGGKTHGYTVPNPTAQTDVIQRALQQAKVDPRTIDYIEAHGTGTALGDPIEIAGLTKAFEAYTQDRQFCAIGSVKSNIGHAESAAGIAGISKILLQMKYGQLVPSLHSKVLNTHIDFASTPFAVQQTLAEWERPPEGPRRAGISSFGAGGANAHVVIEEYIPEAAQETIAVSPGPYLIVLSAQSEGQLLEQAKRLLSAVTEAGWTDRDLADIAYTLQIGREAMDERLAVVVTSIADLKAKLTDIIAQTPDMTDYYRGEVKAHKAAMAVLVDEDMAVTLEAWQQKGKYDKLLKLWVKGMAVDWERLYSETKPRRISLPTYPFTRDRYWIPVEEPKGQGITEAFHPLLHQNTSDFYEQRFSTRFTGEEPFLSDHVVGGQRMLPGSAYLEMARAAVSQAVGGWLGEGEGIRLQQVGWVRPLIVGDEPVEIHMGLAVEKDETIRFDVYRETDEGEEVVYSEGRAELLTEKAPPLVDLSRIQQACGQKELSREAVYTAFANMGIQYGESHRGIERIYVGQEEVLARLTLASPWVHGGLHPGMVDAAIQAGIGLQEGFDQRQPSV
ncbi:type I polyketide synthase, partial [Bacillus inaquosorum]|uniref:type I polyketide synthase n=1 Tax=Bacillus inaquosorum TaxID=483913 RepID=UPI002DBCB9BD